MVGYLYFKFVLQTSECIFVLLKTGMRRICCFVTSEELITFMITTNTINIYSNNRYLSKL